MNRDHKKPTRYDGGLDSIASVWVVPETLFGKFRVLRVPLRSNDVSATLFLHAVMPSIRIDSEHVPRPFSAYFQRFDILPNRLKLPFTTSTENIGQG